MGVRSKEGVRLRSTQWSSMVEPEKIQGQCLLIFFLLVYVAYNCLVDVVDSCFHTTFLSSSDFFLPSSK